MIDKAINRLEFLCDTIPNLLTEIGEPAFSEKPTPDKWSKKEIIGHLIDSATNNHHRFIRGQFEELPAIAYNQNKWNEFSYYQKADGQQLIAFWLAYNKYLLELIRLIPKDKLQRLCNTSEDKNHTLDYLINDYVVHLEHHLKQVVTY